MRQRVTYLVPPNGIDPADVKLDGGTELTYQHDHAAEERRIALSLTDLPPEVG